MNFLSLCQRLRQECGISGTGPAAVTSQTGEMQRLIDWTNQAWMEIQGRNTDWEFLRTSDTGLATTLGNQFVGLPADFNAPIALTLTDSNGSKRPITFMEKGDFDATYRLATLTEQPPSRWTRTGSNIQFNTLADAAYPLILEYFKKPSLMVASTDVPGSLPDAYHDVIIYQAMIYYGLFDAAEEVVARGRRGLATRMPRLMMDQLPSIGRARPLA